MTLYLGLGGEYNITPHMSVGVLGSYFMERDSYDSDKDIGKYRPGIWAVTANFGYMF